MINNRLKEIASYIEDGSKIIDVGCDHALLDIFVAKNKKVAKIMASDISSGPLKQAQKNITNANLEDEIELRLGNGLEVIDEDIDTIIISGMGGLTITDILNKKYLGNITTMILSPNNGISKVRTHLNDLGYMVDKESLVREKNIIYIVLKYVRGTRKLEKNELKYGTYQLRCHELYDSYISECLAKDIKILTKIPKKHIIKRLKIKKEIIDIRRII